MNKEMDKESMSSPLPFTQSSRVSNSQMPRSVNLATTYKSPVVVETVLLARNTSMRSHAPHRHHDAPGSSLGTRKPQFGDSKRIPPTHAPAQPQEQQLYKTNTMLQFVCSIRILTALLCAAFIIATAVCLLVTTFTFSMSAAQDIAEQHAVSIATKAKNDVEGLLNKPLSSVLGWQYVHSQGDHALPKDFKADRPPTLNVSDSLTRESSAYPTPWYAPYWAEFVMSMRSTNFGYQYAVIGFDDGNYLECYNVPPHDLTDAFACKAIQWYDRPVNGSGTSTSYQEFYHKQNYSFIGNTLARSTYDPRTRGWYKMVDHAPFAMKWSTVYLSAMPTLPLMDLNAAVYNATGHLLGIASLAYELSTLTTFLANLATTENTVSVLIDNENLLLASSYRDPYLTRTAVPNPYTGVVPPDCLKSDSANSATESIILCRAAVSSYSFAPLRELALSEPALVRDGAEGARRIRLDGTDYFVSVVPITTELAEGMHWRFALFVPQSDIVSGIIRGRDIAIYIAIAIVVVVVGLCFAILTLLLSPLKSVTESMYRLATLQDTEVESTPSRLQEIATIQGAFKVMSEELTKVKSFLPQSVLAQLYGSSSEGEDDDEGDYAAAGERDGDCGETDAAISATDESKSALDHVSGRASEISGSAMASGVHTDSSAPTQRTAANDARTRTRHPTHGRHANQPNKALNAALSISTRRVTMLAVNIAAYHHHVVEADPGSVMSVSSDVVSAVSNAVNEYKGVLDGFQGDKFMASFNAVTSVGNHRTAAASAALLARSALSNIAVRPGGKPLRMTAGIASGPAMVGNMGTQTVKRFTVLGHVVTNAGLLERLCKAYSGASVLAEASVITEAESVHEVLCCDVVGLPCRTSASSSLSPAKGKDVRRARVFAVVGPKDLSADEWMYSLDHGAKVSRYAVLNDAFELFLSGDAPGCAAALERCGSSACEEVCDVGVADGEALAGGVLRRLRALVVLGDGGAVVNGPSYVNPLRDYYATLIGAHVDEGRGMVVGGELAAEAHKHPQQAFEVQDI